MFIFIFIFVLVFTLLLLLLLLLLFIVAVVLLLCMTAAVIALGSRTRGLRPVDVSGSILSLRFIAAANEDVFSPPPMARRREDVRVGAAGGMTASCGGGLGLGLES